METFINTRTIIWHALLLNLIDGGPPPCFSDIYCHGSILETVQMARIYSDSKTFVDMKMKFPPAKTKELFAHFMENFTARKPNRKEITIFVETYFEPPAAEYEQWKPDDWVPFPKFLNHIIDPHFKLWAHRLHVTWNQLGRKIRKTVKNNKDLYSIIWVPNPTIVPGGRFSEFYYWDSYWIIQGLLLSEMISTTRGMLENFLYMVDNYGLIPNGGRVYYIARSQPPMLIPSIKLYYDFTRDITFISKNIKLMEKELDYWISNHSRIVTVSGVAYTLAAYGDYSSGPRPESYFEDVASANIFDTYPEKDAFYSELKAAAESGWDFSSRWFLKEEGHLTDTKTRFIIPVELNAILYWNAKIVAQFNTLLANKAQAAKYDGIASTWLKAITAVLWHDDVGVWLDYDLINNVRRNHFFPTNIAPLWTGCYSASNKDNITNGVLKYLKNIPFLYPGGVPTTFQHSGEQWNFPNAWPPLQHMMIVGLHSTGNDQAIKLAYRIAATWVDSNYDVFKEKGYMAEKYDATGHGAGYGGEYEVQLGFGWSNGVILDLLYRYGDRLASRAGISLLRINVSIINVKTIIVLTFVLLTF